MRAAVYTRVSTDEQAERGHSIDEQERLGREAVAERGYELFDVYRDPGYSGASEDRPALRQMLDRLDELDVIVVWAMDRLARDVELFARLTKRLTAADVRIESLTAHVDLSTPEGRAMAGVSSVFGEFEKERIAERVRAALKARKLKGLHPGGPAPDGWMNVDGERVPDPDRAPVIRHLFDLAAEGMPDGALARHLNAEGHRTRSGRPWDRRAVQNHVTKEWHAGRLVDRATFDRIQAGRAKRDHAAPAEHTKGAPARRHLLSRLARCGSCGSPIFAVTSPYRRKDGTKARHYECRGYRFSDGTCDVRVDAEAVDAAVLDNLPRVMPDFNRWVEQIEDRHAAERERLAQEVDRARKARDHQARKAAAVEAKWSEFEAAGDDNADVVLPIVRREQRALEQAENRLAAAASALESVPEEVERDRLLDFASGLRAEIRGRVEGDRSVERLNRTLAELFSAFTIFRELPEDLLPEELDASVDANAAYVFPNLRREVWERLLAEYDEGEPAPPLEWIEAFGKSANTHEYRLRNPNRRAFCASQP